MQGDPPAKATTPTSAVFLSYASEDAAAAERIATALRNAGIEVWFDKSELRGGDAWDRRIREQIHNCRLFIPVISANSERRDEGYFRREWALAADRTRDMAHRRAFLVPVAIDGTPERGASVPDKFHELQWTRLPGGETSSAFVERVRGLLVPDASPARAATPGAGSATVALSPVLLGQPQRSKALLWAGVVFAVALSYFVLDKLWLSKVHGPSAGAVLSATAPEKSIAVLPFVDLSERHDQEYFADGMAEEVLDLLAKVPQLKVIGRTSSFRFKGKADDVRTIGARLGANYILEGSVRNSLDRVRITAQLIAAQTGLHVWSESYERTLSDALKVQSEIAAGLVRALQVAVGADEVLAEQPNTQNPKAYEAYLRARHAYDRGDKVGIEEAIRYYEEAARLDPKYIPAALGLAEAYTGLFTAAMVPREIGYERAKTETLSVLNKYPQLASAHADMARILQHDFEWAAAQQEVRKARELDPRNVRVMAVAGQIASSVGDWSNALSFTAQALETDPLNPDNIYNLADYQLRSGHPQESEKLARRVLNISPTHTWANFTLGAALLEEGRLQESLDAFNHTDFPDARLVGRAAVYHAMGHKEESDMAMQELENRWSKDAPFEVAMAHGYRGELELALPWLSRAAERKDVWITECMGEPSLKNVADDVRYRAWLRSVGLPQLE